MKPFVIRLLSAALLLMIVFVSAPTNHAASQPIKVYLDSESIAFSVDPFLDQGTTLVQLRPLFEAMGLELEWQGESKTIIGTRDDIHLTMQIGNQEATVNGETIHILQAPRIIDGHTLVPIRFISESTGAHVAWNSAAQEIVITSIDSEAPVPGTSNGYTPAVTGEVNLAELTGMYVGYRLDRNGYECGGLCVDTYTFLANDTVVFGLPENGGPETIQCDVDECLSYDIQDGQLITDRETFEIAVEDGVLVINDVELTPVLPVNGDYTLDGTFEYTGYYGTGMIGSYTTFWTYTLVFKPDGTFESDTFRLGSLDSGAAIAHGFSGEEGSGTYSVQDNTLVLSYDDGKEERLLFFEDIDENDDFLGVQLGDQVYYLQ